MADNEAGAADPELRRMQSKPKPRAVITHVKLGAKCSGAAAKAGAAAAKPGAAAAKAGAAAGKGEAEAESSSNSDSDDSAEFNTDLSAFLKEQLHLDDGENHFCANPTCKTNKQEKTSNGGWCFKCHEAYYCSPECQGLAWPMHRLGCDGREVKGPTIPLDYWPDKVVSDAVRVVVGDGTPKGTARESTRRRKLLLTAVMTFKAELVHNLLGLRVVKGPEALAKQHQIVRLSFHQIAVCFLFLGEARRARNYLRMAESDWKSSQSLCPAGEFSLYAPQWETLPRFARFVARDNNMHLLVKHLGKCEPADVDRRRILGLGIVSEMDKKIAAGSRFLRTFDFVQLLYQTWLVSLVYEYEFRILRQQYYVSSAITAMQNEPDVMTTAQAVEAKCMVKHMMAGSEIRSWRVTAAETCTEEVVRMCSNPKCKLGRWGVISTGTKVCPKCDTARYCSRECQKEDWPDHKPMCARLGGNTILTPCNEDVRNAANSLDRVGDLALLLTVLRESIAEGKPGVREMYDSRKWLECPEDSTQEVLSKMRGCVCSVLEWIISATQVLLMQGRTEKAFNQLRDASEVADMRLLVPDDLEDVIATVTASAEMDRRIEKLRDEVTYYMQEQKLVRLMHERARSPAGDKNIMLYSAIFDEISSQIAFCQQRGYVAREFYARYLLWREARRYRDEYTGQEHKHMYFVDDKTRIEEVLEAVDDAHIATQQLCDAYASESRVQQTESEQRKVALDMGYKQLCMMGTYGMLEGEVTRMQV